MPKMSIGTLRDASNADIINAVRLNASPDYQARVPVVTRENLASGLAALDSSRPTFNEFVNILINRIGTTVVQSKSWSNPLKEFKRGKLGMGESIQEIMTGLLEAYTYNPERDYGEKALFGTERPDADVQYHHVTRQEFYKISVNENILKRAFVSDGDLGSFVSSVMDAPVTSDNWDEFLLMCSLFSEYERQGGFYHVHVDEFGQTGSGARSDAEVARDALYTMRTLADNMTFISTKYNSAHMPTHCKPSDMILFATPEFKNKIDVEGLASLFNVSYAEVPNRVVTIPSENMAIDGAQAVLTSKDFFVVADTLLENTSQWNPVSLATNYFMHHHEIISASRFVPAVLLWNGKDDGVVRLAPPIESVAVKVLDGDGTEVTSLKANHLYEVQVTPTPANASGNPIVRINNSVNDPSTYVKDGLLRVGPTESSSIQLSVIWGDVSKVVSLGSPVYEEGQAYDRWPAGAFKVATLSFGEKTIDQSVLTQTQTGNTVNVVVTDDSLPSSGSVTLTTANGATATATASASGAKFYIGLGNATIVTFNVVNA